MTRKRILIAEDEAAYRDILKDALAKDPYEVSFANNGEDVLIQAHAHPPDLLLLDLLMPIKNGFQVLEELRREDAFKKTKIIVLSNLVQESEVETAQKLGADDFIIKSDIEFHTLISKIREWLQ